MSFGIGSLVAWQLKTMGAMLKDETASGVGTVVALDEKSVTLEVLHTGTQQLRRLTFCLKDVTLRPI